MTVQLWPGIWSSRTQCAAPQGGKWSTATVSDMLHNPVLIGRRTDASGKTILKVEPILDRKTWDALQTKQSGRAKTTGGKPKAMLTGVAVCGLCGVPLYRQTTKAKGKTYLYYRARPAA
jgi:Recombinase